MASLLKKDCLFKFDDDNRKEFKKIKEYIMLTLVLVILYYSKDFIIFSFTSKDTIFGVILQKNSDNMEQPIAFMSNILRDLEMQYAII